MQVTRDDGLIDIDQAAALARVRRKTIPTWVQRGHLKVAGLGEKTGINGRVYVISLYRPEDVIAAEAKLRKAARRIIIPRTAD
jgi:hypothetical protein